MAHTPSLICDSTALVDGGKGMRFTVERDGAKLPAFAVRYDGRVYAYLNSCAHIPIELDWNEGEFFDSSGLYLICSTHGATYEPETGHCVMGPCKGDRLVGLRVVERDGKVYLLESDMHHG
jgi:nitrite reductase/ring-hydroxylating ferredoxin subunit